MSNWWLRLEGETLGLPLDIDCLPIDVNHLFSDGSSLIIKKHFAEKELLKISERSSSHSGLGEIVLNPRRKPAPGNLDSQPAMSCTPSQCVAVFFRCTERSTWTGAVERARASYKRTCKVRCVIFYPKRSQPTHPSSCVTFRKKKKRRTYEMLPYWALAGSAGFVACIALSSAPWCFEHCGIGRWLQTRGRCSVVLKSRIWSHPGRDKFVCRWCLPSVSTLYWWGPIVRNSSIVFNQSRRISFFLFSVDTSHRIIFLIFWQRPKRHTGCDWEHFDNLPVITLSMKVLDL